MTVDDVRDIARELTATHTGRLWYLNHDQGEDAVLAVVSALVARGYVVQPRTKRKRRERKEGRKP